MYEISNEKNKRTHLLGVSVGYHRIPEDTYQILPAAISQSAIYQI